MLFMINMKIRGGIICIVMLLFVGLIISPTTGSIFKAVETTSSTLGDDDTVTVYFWDCTIKPREKTIIEFTESEWNNLKEDLREIRTTSVSIEESFNAQFTLFKEYGFIDYDTSYETIEEKFMEEFKDRNPRIPRQPRDTNIIFNVMSAINFELDSGTSRVFGLNTFINLVGFDIISFHNGHSPEGIQAIGLVGNQQSDPGDYIGFMFGFLGYWSGTMTGTGTYSDLVAAGFTVTTAWFPKLN